MLVGAVITGYRMRPSDEPCASLEYEILDKKERMYVTEGELNNLLRSQNLYPVGRALDRRQIYDIEQTITHHPMIRTAECYVTPRSEMRIRVTQRVPLLRVQVPGDTYFIDTDRRVMQARAVVKDSVLIATGAVGPQIASRQLADFAQWLQDEPYWRARIRFVHVQTPQMIYLYMRQPGQPRVLLGNMNRYAQKLAKMRTFLENSAEATKDKHYIEYDLRFHGQVIGRY
jgi:cell division protein FtsQ